MKTLTSLLILSTALLSIVAQKASAQEAPLAIFTEIEGKEYLAKAAETARLAAAAKTFEEFKASVFREPFEGGKFIVNGDTPIATEEGLLEFYNKSILMTPPPTTELAVNTVNGKDTIWANNVKNNLTYCVSNTFGANFNTVVTAMAAASNAWGSVANVTLVHAAAEDANCTAGNNNVMFDVRPVNFGQYLARAFFPDDARPARNVLIDDDSFGVTGNLTLAGILRHELGHAIGYRHEHTRPESGTCFEDANWRGVTSYDAFSVMHYPQCNGQGDWSLTLTPRDQSGAACLYGAAAGFNIDPTICTPTAIVGTADIVWQHREGQAHFWPMLNGQRQGGTNIFVPVGGEWTLRGVGDVDGDNTDDIVWQHRNGQVHYWPMKNGVRQGGINIAGPVGGEWRLIGVGDLNGDKTDDIVWQHNNGQMHYWPMKNGARQSGNNIAGPVGFEWSAKTIGDVNGDGTDDIIWQHNSGQVHYWLIQNGQSQSGINIAGPVGGEWSLLAAGDVDADGTDDIIWQHRNGQVHYWPMKNGVRQGGINIAGPVGGEWRLAGAGNVD
jgi:FG-GAP-like repeat/Dual-action HEIGH metallo-peptidase